MCDAAYPVDWNSLRPYILLSSGFSNTIDIREYICLHSSYSSLTRACLEFPYFPRNLIKFESFIKAAFDELAIQKHILTRRATKALCVCVLCLHNKCKWGFVFHHRNPLPHFLLAYGDGVLILRVRLTYTHRQNPFRYADWFLPPSPWIHPIFCAHVLADAPTVSCVLSFWPPVEQYRKQPLTLYTWFCAAWKEDTNVWAKGVDTV